MRHIPMYPRGSNGAGQAILDARALADSLAAEKDMPKGALAYDRLRVGATAEVVRTNRTTPPDAILREVYLRSGDKPFARIEDVIVAGGNGRDHQPLQEDRRLRQAVAGAETRRGLSGIRQREVDSPQNLSGCVSGATRCTTGRQLRDAVGDGDRQRKRAERSQLKRRALATCGTRQMSAIVSRSPRQ